MLAMNGAVTSRSARVSQLGQGIGTVDSLDTRHEADKHTPRQWERHVRTQLADAIRTIILRQVAFGGGKPDEDSTAFHTDNVPDLQCVHG